MVLRAPSSHSKSRAAVRAAALAMAALVAAGAPAQAGFFDFLFGGWNRPSPPPQVNSYAEPGAPVAPAVPGGPESVRGAGGGGRFVAFCVRLCDGRNFPMERLADATPVETCRAMCPTAKTKVFFGTDIAGATARDGAHYADLEHAFLYRKQLVAHCTCNGKDAFGLAPFDLSSDPTLKVGDIVATKDGYKVYTGTGRTGQAFAPLETATVNAQLVAGFAKPSSNKLARSGAPAPADDDPGTITSALPSPPSGASSR